MFQISNQWMLFLLDVSIKALLLAAIAGISLKFLKLRDSNVRHRVWSGVLAGMLLLPLLALVLPTIPLSIPAGWTNIESTVEKTPLEPTHVAINNANTIGQPYENNLLENREVPASLPVNLPESIPPSISQEAEIANTTAIVSNEDSSRILLAVPDALFIFWIAVSCIFALRLVTGLWSSLQLLRRSQIVDGPQIQDCLAELPTALSRRLPTIRESNEVLVPVTVGWLRPTVLLPAEWKTWTHEKLSAIVAHEFTHVARRDFFVTLAAELNRCLYWFHPVSWWLRSRLSDLAEEACDDAAIGHTGDRTGYARHLLEVATSLTSGSGKRVQPGLSMARESNVESRITTILDFKRPLSQHLTWRSATAIALVAIPVIATAAAIRPASSAITTSDEVPMATASATDDDDAPTTETETVHIQGQVTDTNAKPIPNAKVRLYRMRFPEWYGGSKPSTLLAEFEVDSEGRFDQTFTKDKIIRETKNHVSWERLPQSHLWWTRLVVSAPNYAYSIFGAEQSGYIIKGKKYITPGFLEKPFTVQLRPAVTIRGRLLSIEGQPVEGASVSAFKVWRPDTRFDTWIQQTSKVPPVKSKNRGMMMGGPVSEDVSFPAADLSLPQKSVQPVVTNNAGIFELSGLAAKDDLVVLRVKGKGITNTTIHVLARDMKTVYGHQPRSSSRAAYYGRTFDFITQPSVPVYGVVRDIETKSPLADIPVTVYTIYGMNVTQKGYIATKTDKKGRYRIEGLPIPPAGTHKDKGNSIAVRPGKLPYIEHDWFHVPRGDGMIPIELNIELRRAVLAKGRLTNKATGAPIALAEIYYAPYTKNENCEKYHRYADGSMRLMGNSDTRYHSDEDGYFAIPVIPGRGVIGATIKAGEFITGFGAEKIEAYQGKDPRELPLMLSDSLISSLSHSLKEIDVPVDSSEFDLSMYVDDGESLTVNFVDPEGAPVKGVEGTGLSSTHHKWKSIKDDHALATGLTIGAIRPMHFSNKAEKLTRFIHLIPEKGQTHFTVKLLPPSRLTGRLVDPEGRPLANAPLETRHQNDPSSIASLPQTQTDKEGRFDYLLPTGTTYKILTQKNKYFIMVNELKNPEPKHIDLGDLILDPEAERWSKAKAKRKPVITDLVSDTVEDATADSNTQD